MSNLPTQRTHYHASGRVHWSLFLPLAALTLLLAAALAVALHVALLSGWYIVAIAPILAALPVAGLVMLTVNLGRCRSRALGIALGIAAAAVLYLGSFHAGLVQTIGLTNAYRLDLLPNYIEFRMRTDVHHDAGPTPGPPSRNPPVPDPALNWFCFCLESGLVLLFTIVAGRARSSRVYCEHCDAWARQELAFLSPSNGKTIHQAMKAGSLAMLPRFPLITVGKGQPYAAAAIEFCRADKGGIACPVYFSLKSVLYGGGVGQFNQYDLAFGRMRIRRAELAPEEIARLAELFPALAAMIDRPLLHLPTAEASAATTAALPPSSCAQVWPAPPEAAGLLLSRRTTITQNFVGLLILVPFFGGIALAGLGAWLTYHALAAGASPIAALPGLLFLALGVASAILGGLAGKRNPGVLSNRNLRNAGLRQLALRTARLIEPHDPEAIFIQIVPRANWGRLMLETASDIGFLRFDSARQQILIEGDKDRYRVPVASILACNVESYVVGQGTNSAIRYVVAVLRVHLPSGEAELPIAGRCVDFFPPQDHRDIAAQMLHQHITELCDELPQRQPAASA